MDAVGPVRAARSVRGAAAVQVAVRPDVLHHQPGGAQAFREGVQNVVTHSRTSC